MSVILKEQQILKGFLVIIVTNFAAMQPQFQLTKFETELISNAEVMLAKNRIIQKVVGLFAALSEEYVSVAATSLITQVNYKSPKISRGENYISLPYVMLDYPRNFSKKDAFAIRTFFWWGQHISIHLYLSGIYKTKYQPKVEIAINKGLLQDWFWCVNQNEWQHHFEEDNYVSMKQGFNATPHEEGNFIKIAKKIPLHQWNSSAETLLESFGLLINIIGD